MGNHICSLTGVFIHILCFWFRCTRLVLWCLSSPHCHRTPFSFSVMSRHATAAGTKFTMETGQTSLIRRFLTILLRQASPLYRDALYLQLALGSRGDASSGPTYGFSISSTFKPSRPQYWHGIQLSFRLLKTCQHRIYMRSRRYCPEGIVNSYIWELIAYWSAASNGPGKENWFHSNICAAFF